MDDIATDRESGFKSESRMTAGMKSIRALLPLENFLSRKKFYDLSGQWFPWMLGIALSCLFLGGYLGLFWVSPDFQQGQAFRIMYVHVPTSLLSLGIFTIIFVNALLFWIWKIKVCDLIAQASAGVGAVYTILALLTGALWGKPMWGSFWVWDARLTSELILLFIYFAYLGLSAAIENETRRVLARNLFAIVGWLDIPIIHFSVNFWTTLHQGASVSKLSKPSIEFTQLMPLIIMIVGFFLLYLGFMLWKCRGLILQQNYQAKLLES